MAKKLFSFLFSDTSTGSESGSKNDGKGNAELVSMGNTEASNQIKLSKEKGNVKGKENDTPEQSVVKTEKRKYKTPKQKHTTNAKTNKNRKAAQKTVRTRTLEINDKTKDTKYDVKMAGNSSLNKKSKVKEIQDFIHQLPPETQELVKEQIKRKVQPEKTENKTKAEQERISKRELLERKRGIYRQEQTALRLAKLAAEKAREMVKAVRDKILRRNKNNNLEPNKNNIQKPNIQQQEKAMDVAKMKNAKDSNTK